MEFFVQFSLTLFDRNVCNSHTYQNMASIAAHCRPLESIVPNRVNTWRPKCRKMSWIPAIIMGKPQLISHWTFERKIQDEVRVYLLCNCRYPQNDCKLDHVVRCTSPMWPILLRTTISVRWQSISVNKMWEIFVHFDVGRDKCTAKTWAVNTKMSPAIWRPACPETMSWPAASSEKMDLRENVWNRDHTVNYAQYQNPIELTTYCCRKAAMATALTSISVRLTNRRQYNASAYARTSTSQWMWTAERWIETKFRFVWILDRMSWTNWKMD